MSGVLQDIQLMLKVTGWQQLVVLCTVVAVVVVVYVVLLRAVRALAASLPIVPRARKALVRAVRWVLLPVAFLVILQQLGADIGQLWTFISAILALVAIGFVAVWSVLSNLLCSILIFLFKPFEEGEQIAICEPAGESPGMRGHVENIGWMYTVLRQKREDGRSYTTTVPNNVFFQKCVSREVSASSEG